VSVEIGDASGEWKVDEESIYVMKRFEGKGVHENTDQGDDSGNERRGDRRIFLLSFVKVGKSRRVDFIWTTESLSVNKILRK
jgi:hypothetical protein